MTIRTSAVKIPLAPGAHIVNSAALYPALHQSDDDGLPLLLIENSLARAVIALQGAQVLAYQPAGAGEMLWLSPNAILKAGTPIRGGIPLCTPWFGPGPDGKSAHGFARVKPWTLLTVDEISGGATRATLELTSDATTDALWPHAFCFRLEIVVGGTLELTFSAENRSAESAPLAFIFHTYFGVAEVRAARVAGLDGTTYIDKVDGAARKIQHGDVRIEGATDRVYLDVPAVQELTCPGGSVRIESDARCAVVWNAWTNDKNVPDLGEGTHAGYLCAERGDVADCARTIAAGETYRTRMTLS